MLYPGKACAFSREHRQAAEAAGHAYVDGEVRCQCGEAAPVGQEPHAWHYRHAVPVGASFLDAVPRSGHALLERACCSCGAASGKPLGYEWDGYVSHVAALAAQEEA